MKSELSHRDFVEQLIEQEPRITAVQLIDLRNNLKRQIVIAQTRERRMRMAVLCTASLVVGMVLSFLAFEALAPPGAWPLDFLLDALPEWSRIVVIGILWVVFGTAAVCVVPFTLLYWLRYGRRARQARDEYILLAIVELQREVSELRRVVESWKP